MGDVVETVPTGPDSSQEDTDCRLQMWLDSRCDTARLLESFSDPAIKFLDLYIRESFLVSFSVPQIQKVMKAIAMMNLERLDISCPYTHNEENNHLNHVGVAQQAALPVSALRLALSHGLTHLLLVNVKISGSHDDFEALASATKSLPRLHCVVLAEIRVVTAHGSGDKRPYSLIDPFVQSLARMPTLSHVLVSGSQDLGVLKPSTMQLFRHNLRDLCLSQLSFSTPHLQAIAQNSLTHLRELDLQCHLTIDGAHALAQILENNNLLEELTLRLTSDSNTFCATPRTAAAYAVLTIGDANNNVNNAIPDNIMEHEVLDEDHLDEIGESDDALQDEEYQRNAILAAAIVQSKQLTSFELESANLSNPLIVEPFHQMIRDNYSLETARLHCCVEKGYCLESEIAFYTRLNYLGRGHLFQCPHCSQCDEAYISMLESLNNEGDLSAFYYFLSRKPSLLSTGSSGSPCSETAVASRKILGKRKRLYRAVKYNGVSYKN